MNSQEAREAYIKLSSMGLQLGPFAFYSSQDSTEFKDINEKISQSLNTFTKVDEGIFELPSPWHAYFFLDSVSHIDPLRFGEGAYKSYIYRGQSSPEKPLATLFRPGANRENAKTAFELFKNYVDEIGFKNKEMFSELNLQIMARHHGLATSHLDFTVDPSVAILFASSGEDKDGYSRVFVSPLRESLSWAKLYIPPVYAQRLYTQRGILVEIPEDEYSVFYKQLIEVKFPKDQKFSVYREGKKINMFQENSLDNLFEYLVTIAKHDQLANNGILDVSLGRKLFELSVLKDESMGHILLNTFDQKKMEDSFEDCLDNFNWMKFAMFYTHLSFGDKGPAPLNSTYDKKVIKAICRDNSYTFNMIFEEIKDATISYINILEETDVPNELKEFFSDLIHNFNRENQKFLKVCSEVIKELH